MTDNKFAPPKVSYEIDPTQTVEDLEKGYKNFTKDNDVLYEELLKYYTDYIMEVLGYLQSDDPFGWKAAFKGIKEDDNK